VYNHIGFFPFFLRRKEIAKAGTPAKIWTTAKAGLPDRVGTLATKEAPVRRLTLVGTLAYQENVKQRRTTRISRMAATAETPERVWKPSTAWKLETASAPATAGKLKTLRLQQEQGCKQNQVHNIRDTKTAGIPTISRTLETVGTPSTEREDINNRDASNDRDASNSDIMDTSKIRDTGNSKALCRKPTATRKLTTAGITKSAWNSNGRRAAHELSFNGIHKSWWKSEKFV
jgi:hypothetical protein